MFGFLNIDKPAGWTSRDVVNRVQKLVRPAKAGHAGTLDPLATGVLVVGVGQATRLVEYVQRQRKEYRGTFLLGKESDTEDVEGDVRERIDAIEPSRSELESVLPQFIGQIEQRPPAYSALKIKGQRAYALARQGQDVALAPRAIEVHSIELVDYTYPQLTLDITCGSGTYIRSLGRDIAAALGTVAVMSALVRTAIGVFHLTDSVALDDLTADNVAAHLLPARLAVPELPALVVNEQEIGRLRQGKRLHRTSHVGASEFAALDGAGSLIALVTPAGDNEFQSVRVFNP
jgi:tRNA pseudouridine55 synthase